MSAFEENLINLVVTLACGAFLVGVCISPFVVVGGFLWSIVLKFKLAVWALGSDDSIGTVKAVSTPPRATKTPPRATKTPKNTKEVISSYSDEYKLPPLPFE